MLLGCHGALGARAGSAWRPGWELQGLKPFVICAGVAAQQAAEKMPNRDSEGRKSRSLSASRARIHRGKGKTARDFARDDSVRAFFPQPVSHPPFAAYKDFRIVTQGPEAQHPLRRHGKKNRRDARYVEVSKRKAGKDTPPGVREG